MPQLNQNDLSRYFYDSSTKKGMTPFYCSIYSKSGLSLISVQQIPLNYPTRCNISQERGGRRISESHEFAGETSRSCMGRERRDLGNENQRHYSQVVSTEGYYQSKQKKSEENFPSFKYLFLLFQYKEDTRGLMTRV